MNSFTDKEPFSKHLEYIGDFVLNFILKKKSAPSTCTCH
jgi:hypothetical protein